MVGLKEVNDSYWHLAWDRILKKFGEIIGSETRSCDVSARGGFSTLTLAHLPAP